MRCQTRGTRFRSRKAFIQHLLTIHEQGTAYGSTDPVDLEPSAAEEESTEPDV